MFTRRPDQTKPVGDEAPAGAIPAGHPSGGDPPAGTAWLELPDGGTVWLDATICSIGRIAPKTVVLPDGFVSSSHAVIQVNAHGAHELTDLRSTNGTYLDGRRLSAPALLQNAMQIRIGPFKLTYRRLVPTSSGGGSTRPFPEGTAVQTYDGPCWILILDLEGFTVRRQQLGQAKAEILIREWIADAKPFIEKNSGVLNAQPGDALLAYWLDNEPERMLPAVDTGIRGLLALQARTLGERPFRIILHRGNVQITSNATRAEHIAGPDVDFVFRLEKLAKTLGARALLSEPAALALDVTGTARSLGAHAVADFAGKHHLYALAAD